MLVGLPEETLPHADSPYAKFNAARGDFPKLEDFLVGYASVYVSVRKWGVRGKSGFHRVCFANHCNTKVLT